MNALLNIAAFVVLLGVLVTVHELGHFVVAKLSKVKVHVFSIGFGKPLLKTRIGETEYRIAMLPLGGYVRMAGADPTESADPAEMRGSFLQKPPWVRILIAMAGPAMNLLLPFAILVPYFVMAGSHDEVTGNSIGAVDSGLPAYKAGLRPGDRIVAVDGAPVSTFWEISERIESYRQSQGPLKLTVERPGEAAPLTIEVQPEGVEQTHPILGYKSTDYRVGYMPDARAADVALVAPDAPLGAAGVKTFDRVLAIDGEAVAGYDALERALAALPAGKTVTLKVERDTPIPDTYTFLQKRETLELPFTAPATGAAAGLTHAGPCIASLAADGPAAKAGLQLGDCILAVDGEPHSLAAFVAQRIANAPEVPKSLEVLRDGQKLTVSLQLERIVFDDALAGEIQQWRTGLKLLNRPDPFVPQPLVANDNRMAYAWTRTVDHVGDKLQELVYMVGGLFTGRVSPTQLGGPLTIYTLAGMQVQQGADSFIALMVMLSLSLAILNLLPVPGLDGGQVLVAAIEMVIRRPLPEKVQAGLFRIGAVMILALILFALGNDLVRQWRLHYG